MLYFIEQLINGIQLGMLLFLLAAGLTLIFGIMDLVNLAHGSLYMIGAYFAATCADWTDSFVLGAILALLATLVVGMVLEMTAIRRLYGRDHLDHVLATFGLLLFFNELVRLIWGPAGLTLSLPSEMLTAVEIIPGVYYPVYRLVIILATLAVVHIAETKQHAYVATMQSDLNNLEEAEEAYFVEFNTYTADVPTDRYMPSPNDTYSVTTATFTGWSAVVTRLNDTGIGVTSCHLASGTAETTASVTCRVVTGARSSAVGRDAAPRVVSQATASAAAKKSPAGANAP